MDIIETRVDFYVDHDSRQRAEIRCLLDNGRVYGYGMIIHPEVQRIAPRGPQQIIGELTTALIRGLETHGEPRCNF